ncbi:MAG: M20/M25/M40 family metallo-hydrolase [bacterium]
MRSNFIKKRFLEFGLEDVAKDRLGNVKGVIPADNSKVCVLISAHMDTLDFSEKEILVSIAEDKAIGAGIGDNSLGLAAMLTVAECLKNAQIGLDSNLVFVATVAEKGEGDSQGMRYFLKRVGYEVLFGLCLEGLPLGYIGHWSEARVRFEIRCKLSEAKSVQDRPVCRADAGPGRGDAIACMSEIVSKLYGLRLPSKPKTRLDIARIWGGTGYDAAAREATIRGELLSEDDRQLAKLEGEIRGLTEAISCKYGAKGTVKVINRSFQAGVSSHHFLVRLTKTIHSQLGIISKPRPCFGDGGVLLRRDIPCLTLGISTGGHQFNAHGYVDIPPILLGLKQVLMVLLEGERLVSDGGQNKFERNTQ